MATRWFSFVDNRVRFLACCLFIVCVGFGCSEPNKLSLLDSSVRSPSGDITVAGSVGVLRLVPGDCFLVGADEIETVDAVPCAEDHQAEVFAIFDLADTEWPGAAAVAQVAKSGCLDRFRNATGHVSIQFIWLSLVTLLANVLGKRLAGFFA